MFLALQLHEQGAGVVLWFTNAALLSVQRPGFGSTLNYFRDQSACRPELGYPNL
jgi:hypothetical protein